jgi:hypothetical protein
MMVSMLFGIGEEKLSGLERTLLGSRTLPGNCRPVLSPLVVLRPVISAGIAWITVPLLMQWLCVPDDRPACEILAGSSPRLLQEDKQRALLTLELFMTGDGCFSCRSVVIKAGRHQAK